MGQTERYDAIVIGAGMSGLSAGIRLAMYDRRVLVLEKHYLWGGLNSFYKRGGRRLDVGLHALTNYVPPRTPGRPLTRVLRQLRIPHADLELSEQTYSETVFADTRLRFSNDFELLRSEVRDCFPSQRAGFERLVADLSEYPDPQEGVPQPMARAMLADYLSDRRMIDALLLPILYYGSPTANDLEWPAFTILFKSLYEEGFARPRGGVKTILDVLRQRFLDQGGVLRTKAGVARVLHADGRATGVELENGERLAADRVLSSAGWVETMQLCDEPLASSHVRPGDAGQLTFIESMSVLDAKPATLGHHATITFFNLTDETVYAVPPGPVDYRSGVVCCPDNYTPDDTEGEGLLRLTLLANFDQWKALPEERYRALKDEVWDRGHAAIADLLFDARPHTTWRDLFTPRTIEHYTGHVNGAVYGTPHKRWSGRTPLEGLFVCGTDQGTLGIVGALLSGIAVANRHVLMAASGPRTKGTVPA